MNVTVARLPSLSLGVLRSPSARVVSLPLPLRPKNIYAGLAGAYEKVGILQRIAFGEGGARQLSNVLTCLSTTLRSFPEHMG